jgi:hypothetical protein
MHFYVTNTQSPDFFPKATLHELGHGSGLLDSNEATKPGRPAFGLYKTSVMNTYRGDQDSLGNMPTFVTVCDRDAAKDAADRQFP